jgi:molecular chaperone DnaJ
MEDYYQILGVPENASEEEIKKRFRDLAKKYHPDRGGDAEKFKKILEAYRILSDKKLREEYDRKRKLGSSFGGFNYGYDFPFNFGNFEDIFKTEDISSLFKDIFEDFWPFTTKEKNFETLNIVLDLEVNLEEVIKGTIKNINYKRKIACYNCDGTGSENKNFIKCENCKGSGKVRIRSNILTGFIFETTKICSNCKGRGKIPEKICSICQGRGYITKEENITIKLPSNFNPREVIKIPKMGDQNPSTKKYGDLLIRIFIKPHHQFQIKGKDLITEIEISPIDLILGKNIKIDFFSEKIDVIIPPGFNQDQIKIYNKGIGGGDLIIKIKIKPIKKLTKRAKELLEELKKEIEE